MTRTLVENVLSQFPTAARRAPEPTFDNLRRTFLPHVIAALPGGATRWGVLRKSGGSIPSDIVVDRDGIHYDVFSGAKVEVVNGIQVWEVTPAWGKIGPIKDKNPAWRWMSLDEAGIVPAPLDQDPPVDPGNPPPPVNPDLEFRVAAIEKWIRRSL